MKQQKQLGLWLLVFVSLGSMIGSGIFNSPKDLISVANPIGTVITWILGGAGAIMLALVFIYLSAKRPEIKSGKFKGIHISLFVSIKYPDTLLRGLD